MCQLDLLMKYVGSTGRGLSTTLAEKKIYTDPNFFIAKTMLEGMIKKIESTERKEKKKIEKLTNTLKKQQDAERTRLSTLLQERKEKLRTEVQRSSLLLHLIS